jgi:tetratricopeptide (TPR) repeat protein
MSSLWDLWARAGGHEAFRRVQAANRAVERKAYSEALDLLTQLISDYPTFAEGWNRRATVYWEMGRCEESVADAHRVVALNPNHFAAWQGLGLCYARLGDLGEACRCIREALRVNPHDPALQSFLNRCEETLQRLPPRERVQYDVI